MDEDADEDDGRTRLEPQSDSKALINLEDVSERGLVLHEDKQYYPSAEDG
jgi:hypothetical protein